MLLKTRFAPRNSRAESRLADARPIGDRPPGWFAVSGRDASKSPGDHRALAARWTGSRRKRPGSRWCISRAHWSAALSSEQSCGSPYRGTRARGSRCPQSVCAGSRARGESGHSRLHLLTTHVTQSRTTVLRRSSGRRRRRGCGRTTALCRARSRARASRGVGTLRPFPPSAWRRSPRGSGSARIRAAGGARALRPYPVSGRHAACGRHGNTPQPPADGCRQRAASARAIPAITASGDSSLSPRIAPRRVNGTKAVAA